MMNEQSDGSSRNGGPSLLVSLGLVLRLRVAGWLIIATAFGLGCTKYADGWILEILLVSTTTLAVAFWLAFRGVACPRCGTSWVAWSLSRNNAGQWIDWLYSFTQCPKCEFTVDDCHDD